MLPALTLWLTAVGVLGKLLFEITMDCIFIVLASHKHYSDVLRASDLVPSLARNYQIVVLTEHYTAEAARSRGLFQHENVIYRKVSVRYPRLWNFSDRYIRTYFVRELDHLDGVRLFDYKFYVHHLGHRILSEIGALLPKRFLTAERCTRIEAHLVRPTEEFLALVRRYRPRLIITATSGVMPLEAEIIVCARKLSIPTAAINLNVDYPHYQSKKARRTDYIAVWNPIMRREVEDYMHYPPDRVFVAGCLRYDHYFTDVERGLVRSREDFLRAKGLDPSRKTIVWSTTTAFYKRVRELMHALLEARADGRLGDYPNILVRLHPSGAWRPYQEFAGTPGVAIDIPARHPVFDEQAKEHKAEMDKHDLVNLTETLLYADVVFLVCSTITIEASLFDKPVVGIGFPKHVRTATYASEPIRWFIARGAARVAASIEEMIKLLNRYLQNPELDRESRLALAQDYVYFTDGRSYERTANFIAEIIAQEKANQAKR